MLEAFGLSDRGCVRPNNEDYFVSDAASGLFILADGMGGAQAGEQASRIGAENLYQYLLSSNDSIGERSLEQGFRGANQAVRDYAKEHPAFEGMGTTLLAVRTQGNSEAEIASVGDSRAYLFSAGRLACVTQDQTWIAEVGARLGMTEESLKQHPMRHVLTMAVGCSEELRIQTAVVPLLEGDQIILCSDGLHGVIDEKTLNDALFSEKSLRHKAHYLVEAAKANGGPDNITVVLIRVV